MSNQYILYEHAAGYALFLTEPANFLQIPDAVSDLNKFKKLCKFVTFQPFKRGREALDNLNSISESLLHPDLESLLISGLPKKKKKYVLGVEDKELISTIKEKLAIPCNMTDEVKELIRGVRSYFHELVPGFSDLNAAMKVQLGLAHAYSRSKVKFNVSRVDNMIIQTITLLDQLDKDINSLTMRLREWYSHHFPELIKIVPENTLYIQCINAIRNRKNIPEDAAEQLQSILNDPNKVQNIMELVRTSMGMDIVECDLNNMYYFVERVTALAQRRKELTDYLRSKLDCIAPNLAALIGDFIAARLIAQAGSLTNLAKAPASTVQVLGAEKALFRALKTRGRTPKYGLLYHSQFISKAAKAHKGRISRYLANKCSVASRIDCFRDIPTAEFGNHLKEQVQDRLKFLKTGEIPRKNTDIMDRALQAAEASRREILKKMKVERKKAKKRKLEESYLSTDLDQTMASFTESNVTDEVNTSRRKKKKKKNRDDSHEQNDQSMAENTFDDLDTSVVKKKKKKKRDNHESTLSEADTSLVKKKRKLNNSYDQNEQSVTALSESTVTPEVAVKKKQKLKYIHETNESMVELAESSLADASSTSIVKTETKELSDQTIATVTETTEAQEAEWQVVKRKKKKKQSH